MMQCEHIHGDGARCLSPAMHRRPFCYMHWRQREHKLPVIEPEFQLPAIDSEASVVLASTQIASAVLAGKLDPKRARIVLACLKMAIDSLRRQQDVSGVSELELTPAMQREFAADHTEETQNHVGTGVLARTGGATAPRSLAAREEVNVPSPTADNAVSSRAARTATRDLLSAPTTTDEALERFIDQHPLMKLKPPTLHEIIGPV